MPKIVSLNSKGFNPFGELVGLNFTQCENGYSQCFLEVVGNLLNPHGFLHGGVVYSLADTGMGGALYTRLDENELCATVEIKIVYFRPVTSGTVTCDTKVIHKGKTIAFLESEIVNIDRPIAKALGTFSIFKGKRDLR